MDLDASLCFCEDQLLRKYNICESMEILYDENEENKLRNEIQTLLSQKIINDADNDGGDGNNVDMEMLKGRMIESKKTAAIITIDKEIERKEKEIKQITRKGFIKCLELMQNRLNISDESMAALSLLSDHVKAVTLKEGDVVMHTTQGSPVHMDADGLYFIQVRDVVWCGVV